MNIEQNAFNQIATTLARHFDTLYYIDIATEEFTAFVTSNLINEKDRPQSGNNFFEMAVTKGIKYVHPDDIERVITVLNKDELVRNLFKNNRIAITYRIIISGKVVHVRHTNILSEDKLHIISCLENIEAEYQAQEEQRINLQSAERLARLDELTGIKNKNAFAEYSQLIDEKINEDRNSQKFAVVMCDVNDLKLINDTRGHNFGDEVIQRASRMICEIYKHSPVFRIGGDEFAVILNDLDYDNREVLLDQLRDESIANGRSRSGPVLATGMAEFIPDKDDDFTTVFGRADTLMYENKRILKSVDAAEDYRKMEKIDMPITAERKRMLDSLFGALITVVGEGYVYLNDMKFDYSRWSLSLVHDFNIKSEYMYHADAVWLDYIHPDDIPTYMEAVEAVMCGKGELRAINYRSRKPDGTYVLMATRCFVLSDPEGNLDYFGGIIIPQK